MQTLGVQNYFLIRFDVLDPGVVVGVAVVDHRALAGESHIRHIAVKIIHCAVFNYDFFCDKLMVTATYAWPGILAAVHYHGDNLRIFLFNWSEHGIAVIGEQLFNAAVAVYGHDLAHIKRVI